MLFHMILKTLCISSWKIALIAFFFLFSTMYFQVRPQMTNFKWCIITLIAFMPLFSTVHFQMTSQVTYVVGWIMTLITLVCLPFTSLSWRSSLDIHFICVFNTVKIFFHGVTKQRTCDRKRQVNSYKTLPRQADTVLNCTQRRHVSYKKVKVNYH